MIPFYLFIYFTLQYGIGFAIHQHESATGVHVFLLLNFFKEIISFPASRRKIKSRT